jgi:hypothetical protein
MPGEIAEMMLDGTLCECCGVLMVDEHEEPAGYPVMCASCAADNDEQTTLRAHEVDMRQRTQCHQRKRTFAGSISLRQHLRDRHGIR